MKRYFIISAFVLCSFTGWSQSMNIHYKNGQTVEYNMDNIDYVEFTEKKQDNTQVSSEKAVDLGLSVKWASYNVGATSPEELGDKYAWGETSIKDKYNEETYVYYNSETQSYMDIGKDIGGTDYDAAHVKWGNGWRMPTYKEFNELKDNCEWKWTNFNGVNGYIVTGKNGNCIFIPPTIMWKDAYWASDLHVTREEGRGQKARCYGISYDAIGNPVGMGRAAGNYIRPVHSK